MKALYLSILLFLTSLFFSLEESYAQITTDPITFNPICPGSIIPVKFNSPGTWLSPTENIVIELSNSSGSFASGTTVLHTGSYASASWFIVWYAVSYNATVNVTIPLSTTPGASYRIRTYSDYSNATGDNGSNLTVNPTAVAGTPGTFSAGATTMCQNSNGTYTVGSVAGAVSYQWSYTGTGVSFSGTGNSVTATFSPTATAGTITVYSVNANGCLSNNAQSRAVTINITPTQPLAFTTSTTSVCAGQSGVTYTVPAVAGATSYNWSYSGTGATITGTTNSVSVNYSALATSGTLSVSATNSCGNSTARTLGITIGTTPAQPAAFTVSSSDICAPQSNVIYTIAPVAGASSYTWTYSGSGATISGGTTNSVSINFSSGASDGNLSVTANFGSCKSSPLTMAVYTSTGRPGRPGNGVSNPGSICPGTTGVAISVPASSGATSYTWTYTGTGATINGSTNNITIDFAADATSGRLSVWGTNGCGNSSNNRFRDLNILAAAAQPSVITTNNASPCPTSTGITYTVDNVGGTTYTWSYSGTGATITSGATSRSITVSYSGATDGTWTVTPNKGSCDGPSRSLAVSLNSTVVAQPSTITPSIASPCNSASGITYSVTNVGGVSYAWSYSGTGAAITAGAGTNAITVTYTAATNGTWTVTPSNACRNGTNQTLPVTFQNGGNWLGTINSSWINASNWTCGTLPSASSDLVILASSPNMPNVNGAATVRNITINPGAKISNNGTLNVYGNFVNNGTYLDKSTTAFVGSTPQTYTGTATDSLNNLTLNNTAGLSITTPLYVKQYLTLTSGNLASAGNLTVDIYLGSILGSGTGTTSGNINVVRTLWSYSWKYISSPLSGKTFDDINDDVTIKFGTKTNLYSYDETVVDPDKEVGWVGVTSTSTSMQSMKGYALYFPLWKYETEVDFTGTYNHNATYSDATLTNTPSTDPLADGWNLVGNPYPSEIDWDAASGWTKTGLDNAIYFWDEANQRYASYVSGIGINGGSRYIPCMQAFYVKVSNPGTGTLGMNKNVRSSIYNRDNWRVASEEKRLHLTATSGAYNDETYIRFIDEATLNFDSQWDAYKLPNGGNAPSLSTKVANEKYAINSLPTNLTDKTIPVIIAVNVSGTYTINANTTAFEDADNIVLEDRLLNVFQDLKTSPSYNAQLVKGDTSTRFFIHYKKEKASEITTDKNNSTTTNKTVSIYAFKQNITINFNDVNVAEANVVVFDAIGNKVYELSNVNASSGKIEMNLTNTNTGVYIVKVASSAGVTTQQVYISR